MMKLPRIKLFFNVALLTALVCCGSFWQNVQAAPVAQQGSLDIIKSSNDRRQYDYTVLDNGLQLLVISDKNVRRAAAAVDVKVGSASDPIAYPGLAHFLEHMLFLGTDKYPNADDFMGFISEHGGANNAYTGFDHTNFYFSIDPKYLHGGLQRFARFFVAPLMDEHYVTRERKAVHSEYQSKIGEPFWRNSDVFKQVVNPKHPYARFNVGSLETLPEETVRPALIEFYRTYYSAERISVVIVGKEDTATLLQWGKTLFAEVPRLEHPGDIDIKEKLFAGCKLPILIKNKTLRRDKTLTLYFQIPYETEEIYNKMSLLLAYSLGYEGRGGLFDTLKKLGYIIRLDGGELKILGHEMTFGVSARLTAKGYENVNTVLGIIFAYFQLFAKDEEGPARYHEMATMARTNFQFREVGNAKQEASMLARRLNVYAVQNILALGSIYSGYDRAVLDKYLSAMTPEQAVVQVTTPDFESEQKTHYFNVPYSVTPLDLQAITLSEADKKAIQGMHLPRKNVFVADDYSLQQSEIKEKHLVLDSGIELYYKNDVSFGVPRSSVKISLQPTAKLSIEEQTAMTLLVKLLNEQLTGDVYDAGVAGLRAGVGASSRTLSLSLQGYQQKMPELLTIVLAKLQNLSVSPKKLARMKKIYRRQLQNFVRNTPYKQTVAYLNKELIDGVSLPSERLPILDGIDEKAVLAVKAKILASLAVRMMVYGNTTYAEAERLAEILVSYLPETELHNKWQKNSAIVLTEDVSVVLPVPHKDNAINYYIQSAEKGYKARAEMGLLGRLIESKFYNTLRTKKQLGYVVFSSPKSILERSGMDFTIESPRVSADVLEKHIVDFNAEFLQSLAELSEKKFAATKSIFITELQQEPSNLMAAAQRYWADIISTGKTDSSRKALAEAVEKVEFQDFISSMEKLFKDGKRVVIKAVPKK